MRLWSEFQPHLYAFTVTPLAASHAPLASKTVTFGMRSFKAQGNRLLINGQPTFLRGTLECCIFPLTGTPPTDERGWMKVFTTAREYGLNHLRFHSWCPPEAAFRVADKMGFYCQVELPNWSLTVNKDSATARFLYNEFDNIIRHYGNHPSVGLGDSHILIELIAILILHDNLHRETARAYTYSCHLYLHVLIDNDILEAIAIIIRINTVELGLGV